MNVVGPVATIHNLAEQGRWKVILGRRSAKAVDLTTLDLGQCKQVASGGRDDEEL